MALGTIGASGIELGMNFASDLLGGLLSSGISYSQANKLMTKQQEWNRQQAEWQNQVNVQNWQMQNEYNTPSNQMKRLQEAGLNPNLMYGNGSASTGNATSAPESASVNSAPMSSPRANIQFSRLGTDAMQAAISLRQQDNNDKLAQSQVDYNNAKQATEYAKGLNLLVGTDLTRFELEKGKQLLDILKGNEIKRGELLQSQIDSGNQSIAESKSRVEVNEKTVEEKAANIALIQARTGLTTYQAALCSAQIGKISHEIANIDSSTHLNEYRSENLFWDSKYKEHTLEDREKLLEQSLLQSITNTQRGEIRLDVEHFERYFQERFGHKPGANLEQAIVGMLHTISLAF